MTMPAGRRIQLLVLSALAVLGAFGAGAAPAASGQKADQAIRSLFGSTLVRAEIVSLDGGSLTDGRINRGKLRKVQARMLTMDEQDGQVARVRVSATTRIVLDGKRVKALHLRRGMQATALQNGSSRAIWVYATRKRSETKSLSKIKSLLTSGLVRAEVISSAGGDSVRDVRVDIGTIVGCDGAYMTLSGGDGISVGMDIEPAAEIQIDNHPATAVDLAAGMEATTIRIDDGAVSRIWASRGKSGGGGGDNNGKGKKK